jgi:peptidoglycan hydrolase-like protein with peptidoglycan-binding domain
MLWDEASAKLSGWSYIAWSMPNVMPTSLGMLKDKRALKKLSSLAGRQVRALQRQLIKLGKKERCPYVTNHGAYGAPTKRR